MKGLEDNKCTRCNKELDYHERYYITEERRVYVSVWCYFCFIREVAKRSGKELKLTDF